MAISILFEMGWIYQSSQLHFSILERSSEGGVWSVKWSIYHWDIISCQNSKKPEKLQNFIHHKQMKETHKSGHLKIEIYTWLMCFCFPVLMIEAVWFEFDYKVNHK